MNVSFVCNYRNTTQVPKKCDTICCKSITNWANHLTSAILQPVFRMYFFFSTEILCLFCIGKMNLYNEFNSIKMVFLPTHSSTRYSRSDCEDDSRFSFSNSSSPQLQSSNGGDNDVEEVSSFTINEITFFSSFQTKICR